MLETIVALHVILPCCIIAVDLYLLAPRLLLFELVQYERRQLAQSFDAWEAPFV